MGSADEQAARAGDESAFRCVAADHAPGLELLCLLMLGCPDRASDAVCETLLRGWRTMDCVPSSTPVRTWLYRLATNVCLEDLDATDESRGRGPLDDLRDPGEPVP
jgi:RNA polymerase sigma-70 factor (ECF subfamily)